MLPANFSFVLPGKLAGMAKPPDDMKPLLKTLKELEGVGIRAVVSLTENSPAPDAFRQAGFRHLHAPVRDFMPPSADQALDVILFVRSCWAEGRGVAIHCAAGYGRTGTMLACVLTSEGRSAREAIDEIRRLRPGSIETLGQESAVKAFAPAADGES